METNSNHFDNRGNAIMVDVSDKESTTRVAKAKGIIKVSDSVLIAIDQGTSKKGDILGVARVAGIMAVKNTPLLIPLCHLLMISKCSVDFEIDFENNEITAECVVKTDGKTGVEMEALAGVAASLLTIYDMCKAIDKSMEIKNIYLAEKSGGQSGHFLNAKDEK